MRFAYACGSAVLLLLAAACSTGQPGVIPAPNPAWRYECDASCVRAPNLIGRVLGPDLRRALIAADVRQGVGEVYLRRSDAPFGAVLAQAPWPGEWMRAAGGLSLVLSGGPTGGSTQVDLCDAFVFRRCMRNAPTVSAFHIEPRTFVMPGEPVQVPDVLGLPRRRAERMLRHAGLYFHAIAAGGTSDDVLAQDPRPGAAIHSTGEVELRVACDAATPTTPSGGYVYDECSGEIYWTGSS